MIWLVRQPWTLLLTMHSIFYDLHVSINMQNMINYNFKIFKFFKYIFYKLTKYTGTYEIILYII